MKVRRQALLDAIAVTEERLKTADMERFTRETELYQKAITDWHDTGRKKFQDYARKLANQKTPVTKEHTGQLKDLAFKGWEKKTKHYYGTTWTTEPPEPYSEKSLPMDLVNLRVLLEASSDEQIETSQLERQGYRNMAALLNTGQRKD